jgi:putative tryptophan/tyrosine transport system substrate-binding protein
MRRRDFIEAIAGTVATWPLAVDAQPASPPTRIGFLPLGSPSNSSDLSLVEAFRKGVSDAGLLEGHDVTLDVVVARKLVLTRRIRWIEGGTGSPS